MFEKRSETSIFSLGQQRASSAPPGYEPYLPFADAWKEFDKLDTAVHGRGRLYVARRITESLIFLLGLGASGFHPSRRFMHIIGVVLTVVVIAEFLLWYTAKTRFKHWTCPRCHSEWPGEKNEKDRACKVCGLRLHQLSP